LKKKVKKGQCHSTKYGSLKHSDLIGKKYGMKVQCTKGTCYILHGSPELWTLSLPHRTQILYTPTISMITLELDLKPGCVVVESGTGSASLSHALIRSIFPNGHLHTFEFHLQRSQTARKEFEEHGVSEYATVYHRDACAEGFQMEDKADAVFLDLPQPWKALESAKVAIKREGGRICSFSPCIEQVQRTCLTLAQLGFTDIHTIESLRRVLSVKKYSMANFDFNMDMTRRPVLPTQLQNEKEIDQEMKNENIIKPPTPTSKQKQPKKSKFNFCSILFNFISFCLNLK
jgi:tRNA (adenine57-N1/adenine58-N1)-methyltransferase catalytic subunit